MKSEKILKLPRRTLRYWLYRIRTEVEDGPKADLPMGYRTLKKHFEDLDGFAGWENFARLWDVGPDGYQDKIIKRKKSSEAEWQETLNRLVKPFPGMVDDDGGKSDV